MSSFEWFIFVISPSPSCQCFYITCHARLTSSNLIFHNLVLLQIWKRALLSILKYYSMMSFPLWHFIYLFFYFFPVWGKEHQHHCRFVSCSVSVFQCRVQRTPCPSSWSVLSENRCCANRTFWLYLFLNGFCCCIPRGKGHLSALCHMENNCYSTSHFSVFSSFTSKAGFASWEGSSVSLRSLPKSSEPLTKGTGQWDRDLFVSIV